MATSPTRQQPASRSAKKKSAAKKPVAKSGVRSAKAVAGRPRGRAVHQKLAPKPADTVAEPARAPAPDVDMSPSQYIVKVDRATGEVLPDPIDPAELLVHAHRDRHPVEIAAQYFASRVVDVTGNEGLVMRGLRLVESAGRGVGRLAANVTGDSSQAGRVSRLLGVTTRDFQFRFRESTHLSEKEMKSRVRELQDEARQKLETLGKRPKFRILLTGATGFLGKEILAQAADHPHVAEVACVVRKETIRDRKTKQVVKVLSARERGDELLQRLHVTGAAARRFRFVEGDIEKPGFGISPRELEEIAPSLTHVIHCAASVSFDDAYESSFRANVLGCRNALAFAEALQARPGGAFVAHLAIETSYIHGRRKRSIAQEDALVFPRHFYNNYYELTKAMASLETDRALVERGLRVTQLLPSIVIGHSRTGNNRGDTKVVNAPINAFGRAKEALAVARRRLGGPRRAWLVNLIATTFPADRSAELNLVPVDRVVSGHPRLARRARRDRSAHPPRHRQPDQVRGRRAHHAGGAGGQHPHGRPDAHAQRDAAAREGSPPRPRRGEARERPRAPGRDLRRLRRVGPAGPRRGQRRPAPRPPDPPARHEGELPDAVPPQQVRAGVRPGP